VPYAKVVARYRDGRLLKGSTADFQPNKDRFHLALADAGPGAKPVEIRLAELKAVFFVRDFKGDPGRHERQLFDPRKPVQGRKLRIVFEDGESLVGTTNSYQPGRLGFFVVPADTDSNNERWFIIASATREVAFL
jgi:hypothetical protein